MAIRRRKFRVSLPGGAIVFSSVNGELTEVIPSWVFMEATAEEDPGEGNIRLDAANPTTTAEIYISAIEGNGGDMGALIEALQFGVIMIRSAVSPEAYHIFRLGSVTGHDGDTWYTLEVLELLGGPHIDPYEEGEVIAVGFALPGTVIGDSEDVGFTPSGNIAAGNVKDALEELDSEKVAKAGDTMTGNLSISKADPDINLDKPASGTSARFVGRMNGDARWAVNLGDQTTEGGGNTGSHFVLRRYADNGTALDNMLIATRAADYISFEKGQIKFPATQNPSTDANTLDDYEEGTFTPTMDFGGSSSGITYSQQLGKYVKIGRLVHIKIAMDLSNNGSGTGAANIVGLPFASEADGVGHEVLGRIVSGGSALNEILLFVHENATTGAIRNAPAAGSADTAATDTNITNSASMRFSGCYAAAA